MLIFPSVFHHIIRCHQHSQHLRHGDGQPDAVTADDGREDVQAAQLEHQCSAYVELKDILPQYDTNGNGSYTQAETEAAIDALSGGEQNLLLVLMGDAREGLSLTRTQKAVLWQIQNKSWKPAKNPYDTKVGQQVYDALHDEESTDAAEDDDLLRQLLGIG